MIWLYTPELSPRIEYTFKLIFSEVMDIDYRISTDSETFQNTTRQHINYSLQNINGVVQIHPSGLLHETGVRSVECPVGKWEELPVIFANNNPQIPFDIFSAVFYLVTRYAEYLHYTPDQYGRFRAEESLSFKLGFLRMPIIDLWCKKLTAVLQIEDQCKNLSTMNYRFRLTIDIDQPWLYKNKGWFYAVGSLFRELIRFDFSEFMARLRVIINQQPDPADSYDLLSEVQKNLPYPIHYFILCKNKGEFDKNRSVSRKVFNRLIQRLDQFQKVGIHPSYVSNSSDEELKREIAYLAKTLRRNILMSRQHFLLLKFPDTYRKLINFGIQEDYSMGYSSRNGFRAGIARSFNFFDLLVNEETSFRIVPFQIMDRTLLTYLKLSPDKAIKEFEYYANVIKNVGGEFVCLWHNDSLNDWGEWKGWNKVFTSMIDMNMKE